MEPAAGVSLPSSLADNGLIVRKGRMTMYNQMILMKMYAKWFVKCIRYLQTKQWFSINWKWWKENQVELCMADLASKVEQCNIILGKMCLLRNKQKAN